MSYLPFAVISKLDLHANSKLLLLALPKLLTINYYLLLAVNVLHKAEELHDVFQIAMPVIWPVGQLAAQLHMLEPAQSYCSLASDPVHTCSKLIIVTLIAKSEGESVGSDSPEAVNST